MKYIKLLNLELSNFKGIRHFQFNLTNNTNVYGANETGKSTLNSAFTWLLTGKDEFERDDFQIKNTKLKELNKLPHEVTGILQVDGNEVKLKRVFIEKWVRERGQKEQIFKGHTTEYYFNDVPVSATEYNAKVSEIIPPDLIKLLTSATYFNSLHWEKQRQHLLRIAGNITNEQVIQSLHHDHAEDFTNLLMVMNAGKTLEEYKKELAAKKALLKKKIAGYQPRIDEVRRNRPETFNWQELEEEIATKERRIGDINQMLEDAAQKVNVANQVYVTKSRKLNSMEFDLEGIKVKARNEILSRQNKIDVDKHATEIEIQNVQAKFNNLQNEALGSKNYIDGYKKKIEENLEKINGLRESWKKINAWKFQFDDNAAVCPTCHQSLPEGDVASKKENLLKSFNENKQQHLNNLVEESNRLKAENADREKSIKEMGVDRSIEMEHLTILLDSLKMKLIELRKASAAFSPEETDLKVEALLHLNGDALNLEEDIARLKKELEGGKVGDNGTDNHVYEVERMNLRSEIANLQKALAMKKVVEDADARIKELQGEERQTAQEIADIENVEFQVEEFMKAKMNILEARVNKLFKHVRFRLFDRQVNGAYVEACVCEYDGVPYPTLNTAAKILAGVDIINTLSNFYSIHAPIFLDNRESTVWIPESQSQIINLYVSDADKKMRVVNS